MLFLLFVASRLVVAGVIQSCSLRNTCTCVRHILCRNRSFLDIRGYTGSTGIGCGQIKRSLGI